MKGRFPAGAFLLGGVMFILCYLALGWESEQHFKDQLAKVNQIQNR